MISNTFIATTTTLLVLFGFAQALPSAPLSCASPLPLFGPHLAPGFVGGTELDQFGLEVRINGQILDPAETVNLVVNGNNVIELIATGGMIFRGFLLKLSSSQDGEDATGYFVSDDENIDTSDNLELCTALAASSLSHTSNVDRTSIKARLMIDEAFDDLKLEATVVISNSVAAPGSEWYQSSYNITVTDVGTCFPGDATVELQDGTTKAMKNLQLGDVVLTNGGKHNKLFEPIYSFGHVNHKASSQFILLKTSTMKTLELTKDHMVFVEGNHAVPASSIQVGDNLILASGELDAVMAINKVVRKTGIYAPFTPSGSIVVNGVKASNFLSFQDGASVLTIGGYSTGLTYQWLSHTFELPHRVWCHSYFGQCKNEQYTAGGVSTWMAAPHQIALWFFQQNAIVMTAVAIPVVVGLASLWTLEQVVCLLLLTPFTTIMAVVAGGGLLVLSSRRHVKTI